MPPRFPPVHVLLSTPLKPRGAFILPDAPAYVNRHLHEGAYCYTIYMDNHNFFRLFLRVLRLTEPKSTLFDNA